MLIRIRSDWPGNDKRFVDDEVKHFSHATEGLIISANGKGLYEGRAFIACCSTTILLLIKDSLLSYILSPCFCEAHVCALNDKYSS